jgi:hypothetical protein
MLPILAGGPHPHDGFLAFARFWRTNSALFPALEEAIGAILAGLGSAEEAWIFARGVMGGVLMLLAVQVARRPVDGAGDLCQRAGLITLWLVLLSPAQFPWYVIWTIPFVAFRPRWSVAAMTALVPLYYLSFHYLARGQYGFFSQAVVWVIWVPVWMGLVADVLSGRQHRPATSPLSRPGGPPGERRA